MVLYTHEEFMKAKGKKILEDKGYTVKNNLIVYGHKEKPQQKNTSNKIAYSEAKLFDLNKAEQKKILNNYGITKIPLLEKNRVKKILEMQNA